jgi:hypothetical protein
MILLHRANDNEMFSFYFDELQDEKPQETRMSLLKSNWTIN